MMTRSKRKRTAEKDKSSPKKSKQTDGAVQVVEMVSMDHGGTSGGLDIDGLRKDYPQEAWPLQEKLNDMVDDDKGEFPRSGLQSTVDMAASSNIISMDPKMLNPVLWRTLPKELLLLVLAHLPLPDITRLRSLSQEWRRELATVNSDINQTCDEASTTMVALLSHSSKNTDAFLVTIYDVTNSRWQYAYHLRLQRPIPWNNELEPRSHMWTLVDACDGGLMCFISFWKPTKSNWLRIVVVNLLTRVQHELPPLYYRYYTLPAMVKIKVDSHTKCYEVVVVANKPRARAGGGLTKIETYDSSKRQWTRSVPPSGSIFGPILSWVSAKNGWCYKLPSWSPSAYDFGEQKLELYTDFKPSMEDWILIDRALGKDNVFDLMEQTQMDTSLGRRLHLSFHIIEYHLDHQTKAWVKEKSYECPGFEDSEVVELSSVSLNACDGFLMVIFHNDYKSKYFRLLDLSTGEWSNIPEIPNSEGLHATQSELCRAFWNVVP